MLGFIIPIAVKLGGTVFSSFMSRLKEKDDKEVALEKLKVERLAIEKETETNINTANVQAENTFLLAQFQHNIDQQKVENKDKQKGREAVIESRTNAFKRRIQFKQGDGMVLALHSLAPLLFASAILSVYLFKEFASISQTGGFALIVESVIGYFFGGAGLTIGSKKKPTIL